SLPLCVYLYGGEWNSLYTAAMLFSLILSPLALHLFYVYRPWRSVSLPSEFNTLFIAWGSVALVLILFAFVTKTSSDFSRVIISSWFVVGFVFLFLAHCSRRLILQNIRAKGKNTKTAIIIGAGDLGRKLAKKIAKSPWMGINILAFFDDRQKTPALNIPFLGSGDDGIEYVRNNRVDIVYLALPMRSAERMKELALLLENSTAAVYLLPDIFMFDLLHTRVHELDGMPILSLCDTPLVGASQFIKRFEDLFLSVIILLMISPLMIIIAAIIKYTSPGPIIFKQRRYGLNGDNVVVWKFRSMKTCEDSGTIKQATQNDSRVTPIGKLLRRSSMDELPQFFNVIQGRMSIVGPRPHAISHNEEYRVLIKGYMWRHKVKPGITGWAQVNGWRGETEELYKMEKRVEYDLWYIRNWSLLLDIKIILKTIVSEIFRKSDNAY
ncbi:MAG: undecaprenyl-phosphate glucose phosphotransferase, partial [Mariprofundales bacterium]